MISAAAARKIVGIVGNVISFCLFLSPLPTFFSIYKKVTVLNCALWVFYGFITPNSLLVITINGIGLVIELIYVAFYLYYANNKQRKSAHAFGSWRGVVIGWLCVAVNIGMYAVPCLAIYQVYDTKSLEYMPFWLSLACFLNGLCWLAYSLLGFDKYILTSNGIGLVLGLIQISVIGYYFFKYPQPKDYISWPKFLKSKKNNNIIDDKAGGGGKVELTDAV
ncbi:hypothetical protein MKW92_004257 [Papaver armeniacum]|nr:hypothetical protein MKW92_004257 [Papaver armeniacum]